MATIPQTPLGDPELDQLMNFLDDPSGLDLNSIPPGTYVPQTPQQIPQTPQQIPQQQQQQLTMQQYQQLQQQQQMLLNQGPRSSNQIQIPMNQNQTQIQIPTGNIVVPQYAQQQAAAAQHQQQQQQYVQQQQNQIQIPQQQQQFAQPQQPQQQPQYMMAPNTPGSSMSLPSTPGTMNSYVSAPVSPSTPGPSGGGLFYQTTAFVNPIPIPAQQRVSLEPVPLSPRTSAFTEAPLQQQSLASTQILNQIMGAVNAQSDFLLKVRAAQKHVMAKPQKPDFDVLTQHHEQLKKQLDAELKTLADMESQLLLTPPEIQKLIHIKQRLVIQSMQLELYHQELQTLTVQQVGPQRVFAILAVVEQPFPLIYNYKKSMDDPIEVQLLSGANVQIQSVSEVKASINIESPQRKVITQKQIENESSKLGEGHKARFQVKFLTGTQKSCATLKFGIQIKVSNQTLSLESNPSSPFIVITNECQYEESDRLLLQAATFRNAEQTYWALFANHLQRHFLKATRQDLLKPNRYLTHYELQYLKEKFFADQNVITLKQFDAFWEWFGKGLQKLRYQRHLCPMWQNGLIYGFVSREAVNAALVKQEVGTFVIRLSERHPGTFAVGYVIEENDPEKRVRHYLIRDEDVHSKRSLPDFLLANSQFTKFLQFLNDPQTGLLQTRIIQKEVVLDQYQTKHGDSKLPQDNQGYDDELYQNGGDEDM